MGSAVPCPRIPHAPRIAYLITVRVLSDEDGFALAIHGEPAEEVLDILIPRDDQIETHCGTYVKPFRCQLHYHLVNGSFHLMEGAGLIGEVFLVGNVIRQS
jgi:hypothetical protein